MEEIKISKKGKRYIGKYDKFTFTIKYNPYISEDSIHWDKLEITGFKNIAEIEMEIFKKYLEFRKNEK
jgi:hypothetical protein